MLPWNVWTQSHSIISQMNAIFSHTPPKISKPTRDGTDSNKLSLHNQIDLKMLKNLVIYHRGKNIHRTWRCVSTVGWTRDVTEVIVQQTICELNTYSSFYLGNGPIVPNVTMVRKAVGHEPQLSFLYILLNGV